MSEEVQVKKRLSKALRHLTGGSVLHILAEIFGEAAEDAKVSNEPLIYQQCKQIEHTLLTVGYGIDATLPR